ncbi:hypothetical protein Goshw_004202 [Gossypium schwendimanii]|uniref:Uncharacterized protein n=1 Tax=Gossypium schwendimanii TaxID=34291 RepID=A0A7J9MA04_GOSSC|nr:hypothetical protein [Gossypium schwendimanii]
MGIKPWLYWNVFEEINKQVEDIGVVSFVNAFRKASRMADTIAKAALQSFSTKRRETFAQNTRRHCYLIPEKNLSKSIRFIHMGKEKEETLGNTNIEDANWLCSLSESELDLLISLKKLALKRASAIGHVQLAKKFDLKMLRALGFVLMECVKEKVKDLSVIPGMDENATFLDSSNLLKCKVDEVMSIEELNECIAIETRKEFRKRPRGKDALVRSSKRRKADEDEDEETAEDYYPAFTFQDDK